MPIPEIIFLASKPVGYLCLEKLIEAHEKKTLKVTGLLTTYRKEWDAQYDLKKLASQHHIPLIATLEDLPECDILYSVQYTDILKERHLKKARQIAVNLHMAPLPEYRGCNQFSWALIENKKEFGTTLHEMETGIDNGDILFEKRFPIPTNCWVSELYALTQEASVALFEETLPSLISGKYQKTKQALLIAERGTSLHWRNEIKTLKCIDLNWDAEKINCHIRATFMPGFEPPYAIINQQKIYFTTTFNAPKTNYMYGNQ